MCRIWTCLASKREHERHVYSSSPILIDREKTELDSILRYTMTEKEGTVKGYSRRNFTAGQKKNSYPWELLITRTSCPEKL